MTLLRFSQITGHDADYTVTNGVVSAFAACTCSDDAVIFSAAAKTLNAALDKLHALIYRHHCQTVFKQQRWKCAYCGKTCINGLDPHHVVKRSKMRLDHISNLRGACRSCHDKQHRVRPADARRTS